MKRVVLDTNIIVSALLVPGGMQASILLLALRGESALYVSAPVLDEHKEVLHRCAEAAEADYLVTGNTRHFPEAHQRTEIITECSFANR